MLSAETAVRRTAIGNASFGNSSISRTTSGGKARLAASWRLNSASSAVEGRRPNHNRYDVSGNVDFSASS